MDNNKYLKKIYPVIGGDLGVNGKFVTFSFKRYKRLKRLCQQADPGDRFEVSLSTSENYFFQLWLAVILFHFMITWKEGYWKSERIWM